MTKTSAILLGSLIWLGFGVELKASPAEDNESIFELMLKSPMDEILTKSITPGDFVTPYILFLEESDISFSQPKGFVLTDSIYVTPYRFTPNKYHTSKYYTTNGVSNYTPPYYSADKDAILIFPLKVGSVSPDILIEDELMAAYDDVDLNCTDMVMCVNNETIMQSCNVDRIYYYEYDIISDQDPNFRHCVGLALRKENHASFPMKLLLTDEGLKNKSKYIQVALDCIHYGDTPQMILIEEEKSLKKLREEGIFPVKRISNTGIIIERPNDDPIDFLKRKYKY